MKVILKSFGALNELIKTEEFFFPGDTIRLAQFFEFLVDRYGLVVGEHLLPEGKFSSHYAVLVNGSNVKQRMDKETELKDGDRVAVFTLVTGG